MFYQETKTARGAAIGTIMPWTGGLTTIPKGWIICDGQSLQASDFPLLAQAIGDTYNAGTSDFNGNPPNNFPNYAGSIKLPNLNGKTLMDIEASYFANTGSGGTGRAADVDPSEPRRRQSGAHHGGWLDRADPRGEFHLLDLARFLRGLCRQPAPLQPCRPGQCACRGGLDARVSHQRGPGQLQAR